MPFHKIPLAIGTTTRTNTHPTATVGKDSYVINGVFEESTNPAIGTKTVHVARRLGTNLNDNSSSGTDFRFLGGGTFWTAKSTTELFTAGVGSGTSLGVITNRVQNQTNFALPQALIGSATVYAFVTTQPAGWFLYSDAITTNFPTFTGNRTSGSAVISGIASTTGIYKGQAISGTGIPASTRVLSVDSSSQITMTANATSGAATATTITKEAVAKIIDADFPTDANSIDVMDGYFFAGTNSGKIYQSAINDPSTWSATDFISADFEPDAISFIFKWQGFIVAAGSGGTIQYFYNAGNPSGSVLSGAENLTIQGLTLRARPVAVGNVGYCVATGDRTGLYALSGANNFTRISDDRWSSVIATDTMYMCAVLVQSAKRLLLLYKFAASSGSASPVVYDPGNGNFSVFQFGTSFKQVASAAGGGIAFIGDSSYYDWSTSYADFSINGDSGTAFSFIVQTEPQILANGLDCTDVWVDLIADTYTTGGGFVGTATITLETNDEDYGTGSYITRGSFDNTKPKKRINALGGSHGPRSYRLTHAGGAAFRMQMLIVNYKQADA